MRVCGVLCSTAVPIKQSDVQQEMAAGISGPKMIFLIKGRISVTGLVAVEAYDAAQWYWASDCELTLQSTHAGAASCPQPGWQAFAEHWKLDAAQGQRLWRKILVV
jgi:hypothetical protein